MFTALDEGRVHDTRIREKLHKIARGGTGDGVILDEEGQSVGAKLSLGGSRINISSSTSESRSAGRPIHVRRARRHSARGVGDASDQLRDTRRPVDGARVLLTRERDTTRGAPRRVCSGARGFRARLDRSGGDARRSGRRGGVFALRSTPEAEELKRELRRVGLLDARGKANTALIKDRVDLILSTRGDEVPKTSSGEVSTSREALLATGGPGSRAPRSVSSRCEARLDVRRRARERCSLRRDLARRVQRVNADRENVVQASEPPEPPATWGGSATASSHATGTCSSSATTMQRR